MSTDTMDVAIPGVRDAQKLIEWATTAAAAADAAVTTAREELAAGRASRGDLVRHQRELAKLLEMKLDAEARVRVLRRDHDAAQKAAAAQREEARRVLVADLVVERRALEGEFAAFLNQFTRDLDALIVRAREWDARARRADPPYGTFGGSGTYPGDLDALIGAKSSLFGLKDAAGRLARDATRRI